MSRHCLATDDDSAVQQAIVSIKKGAYMLKCGQRGKPKFCAFKLSPDEKFLIWYSGKEERQLRLSSTTRIIPGQKTVSFKRHIQPERECQSFSLVYAKGKHSLDLICKDKVQSDYWILGLRAVISRCHHGRPLDSLRSCRGVQSCLNSPAGVFRRKQNLGLLDDTTEYSQVRSLCGSPTLSERRFSDGLSYSFNSFYPLESVLSNMRNVMDMSVPNSPYFEPDHLKKRGMSWDADYEDSVSDRFVSSAFGTPRIEKDNVLKDVMIWGENIGGNVEGVVNRFGKYRGQKIDALLPKLLESTTMLDVHNISLGGKHAALVTKQGEVFCWGEANRGRLGHKIDMDVSYPKVIDSLNGAQVKSVACGEYHTCAVTHSGELYTWGDTYCGSDLVVEEKKWSRWLPHKLSGPLNIKRISTVTCGELHTAIVSTSGQLFTFGDGTFGVLGHGNLQSVYQPKEVEYLKGSWVKSVACGSWHTAAVVKIMADRPRFNAIGGNLYTWGDGANGKLGHADHERKLVPTCVAHLLDNNFVQVCCSRMLTVALTNQGKVYTIGSGEHGQLGNPQDKDKSITLVQGNLKEEFIKEIAAGSYHVAVLTNKGSVCTWGKGENGQLGLGDVDDRNMPTFVEALRDRKVESVVCGSKSTAAICLHKCISVNDQSACCGCNLPFGFTRKKHNCYNCGLLFCHSCSSKKAMNASFAPKKRKAFRVCDPCFNNLQELTQSCRPFKEGNHSKKQQLTEEKVGVAPEYGHLVYSKHGCNQSHLEPVSCFSGLPLWGQVPCPALFKPYCRENITTLNSLSKNQLSSVFPVPSECIISSATNTVKCVSMPNEMLREEVRRLRAEAISLEQKCEIGNQKIQDCQQKIEETWSVAREGAGRYKAAKEVIKALALRLNTMQEKVSVGRKEMNGVKLILPQLPPLNTNSSNFEGLQCAFVTRHLLPEVDNVSTSPILFYDTPKSLNERDICLDKCRSEVDFHGAKIEPEQREAERVILEWVEQYIPGVYITLVVLLSGQKGLKRVRFSRKKFSTKEAEIWWEENKLLVHQKYDIDEGYMNSNQN